MVVMINVDVAWNEIQLAVGAESEEITYKKSDGIGYCLERGGQVHDNKYTMKEVVMTIDGG